MNYIKIKAFVSITQRRWSNEKIMQRHALSRNVGKMFSTIRPYVHNIHDAMLIDYHSFERKILRHLFKCGICWFSFFFIQAKMIKTSNDLFFLFHIVAHYFCYDTVNNVFVLCKPRSFIIYLTNSCAHSYHLF